MIIIEIILNILPAGTYKNCLSRNLCLTFYIGFTCLFVGRPLGFVRATLRVATPNHPTTLSCFGARASTLWVSAPCAPNQLSPKRKKKPVSNIHQHFCFFQKARTVRNSTKTFCLRQKDFCPSGSRCFDEYLDFSKTPPTQQSQTGDFSQLCCLSHRLLCVCLPLRIFIVIKN